MLTTGDVRPPLPSWTEIDGVPTVWGGVEGPLMGTLIFRVGRSDETLPISGITHLVEHLALYREGLASGGPHFNGQVDDLVAMFYTSGEPDEVGAFLSRVTGHLCDLPQERLTAERDILLSEASGRSLSGGYLSLLRWRYGPRTYGISAYDEFGFYRLQAPDVMAWTAARFTRQNAVLLLTGEPPANLSLQLPDGQRFPTVEPSSALPELPAWYAEGEPGAALSAIVQRSTSATALRHVVEHRLRARLRYELGASYSPAVGYEPRDATFGHLFIGADAVPEHADAVRREVATVLLELSEDDVVAADLPAWRRGYVQNIADAGARRGWLFTRAHDVLLGREQLEFEDWVRELQAVEPEQVVALAREAHAASLVRLGGDFQHELTDRSPAPVWSTGGELGGVPYEEIREKPDRPSTRLVVGNRTVGVDLGQGRRVKIAYEETAAVLRWPDGQVTLIGNDAFSLRVDPALWVDGTTAVSRITEHLPHDLWVDLPQRDSEARPGFGEPKGTWAWLVVCLAVVLVTVVGLASGATGSVLGILTGGAGAIWSWRELTAIRRVRGLPPLPGQRRQH